MTTTEEARTPGQIAHDAAYNLPPDSKLWQGQTDGVRDFWNRAAAALAAAPSSPGVPDSVRALSEAAKSVLAERRRQIIAEGWTPEHDDTHNRCEMAIAAACYATAPSPVGIEREWVYPNAPKNWPWCRSWWKPGFYRRNLVKAGALIIAEIERWDRANKIAGQSVDIGHDALDAARFRALMRCGRIKMQGSAGVDADTGALKYPDQPGSVHFGAEFWPESEGEADRHTIWGRHCLRALADDILALEGSALISTHPAGQSTGPGAKIAVKQFAHAVLHGDEEHRGWLTEAAECFVAGKPLPEPRGKGTQQPAPDSTRTGPDGAEEVAKALYRHDYGAYPDQPEWDGAPAPVQARYRSLASAARPAAPEAQAAWSFDMEAAPRDGSDVEIVNDRGQFIAQFDVTWSDGGWWMVSDGKDPERPLRGNEPFAWRIPTKAPAPPASSGQERA